MPRSKRLTRPATNLVYRTSRTTAAWDIKGQYDQCDPDCCSHEHIITPQNQLTMLSISLLVLSILPQAFGCAEHTNYIAPRHGKRQALTMGQTHRVPKYWSYEASYDWGKISPEYILCQTGTQQAPIALGLNQGLSQRHKPNFAGYGANATGEYYNYGTGPAFTFYHPEGDYSGLPSMVVDGETLYMTGWHIHAPADHTVSGDRSKAELHYVQ